MDVTDVLKCNHCSTLLRAPAGARQVRCTSCRNVVGVPPQVMAAAARKAGGNAQRTVQYQPPRPQYQPPQQQYQPPRPQQTRQQYRPASAPSRPVSVTKGKRGSMVDSGFCCCQCVQTSEVGIIERFGKYDRLAEPGLFCLLYPMETIITRVSLRLQQLIISCETKTKDNVFVDVDVAVQYRVVPGSEYNSYYSLTSPIEQITSYVFDVVRSTVPKMTVDDAFESKDIVADAVRQQLTQVMSEFGFEIIKALVTDLKPAKKVRDAMNEINAQTRLRSAAHDRAEAAKVLVVKAAEADAESKYLSGLGIARQRKAIVDGLRSSVLHFSDNVHGTSPGDVMNLLMVTQYFDMLKDVGQQEGVESVFLPDTGEPGDFTGQVSELLPPADPEAQGLLSSLSMKRTL